MKKLMWALLLASGLTSSGFCAMLGQAFSSPASATPVTSSSSGDGSFDSRYNFLSQQVQAGLYSGKYNKQQALTLQNNLKTVLAQEQKFLTVNGNNTLTTSQQNQLNQSLNNIQKTMGLGASKTTAKTTSAASLESLKSNGTTPR